MSEDVIEEPVTFDQVFSQFLCDSPLYTSLELSADEYTKEQQINLIRNSEIKIDMHCTICKRESIFTRKNKYNYNTSLANARDAEILLRNEYSLFFHCSRDSSHLSKFCLIISDNTVVKFGQIPSMESISGSDIKQYRSVLADEDFIELRRASGLASHGMGIAPYVYLRRIFERLIFNHYSEHKEVSGDIEGFDKMRIEDKIAALSHSLPDSLLDNKSVYKILSKGIHELDEKRCLKYYPVVRTTIIEILEADLQRKNKAKAAKESKKALEKALAELKDD